MGIALGILLFSVLIFVHELGHFVAAKLSGVRVNEFSMFMGPAIFKKKIGETVYSLRLFPIGGFCAMEGEDGQSSDPRSFGSAAWWKRLIILVAGAAMNLLMGIVLMGVVFWPASYLAEPVIASYEPGSTLFGENGLKTGDRILEIDGEKIYVEADFTMLLTLKPAQTHDLVVLRDGQKVTLKDFPMEKHEFVGDDGEISLRYGFSFSSAPATVANKIKYIWNQVLDTVRIVRLSLQMLLTGQVGVQEMSGPVGIVQQISQTAEQSETARETALNMAYFGAFLAINLAVMNMLPIPALDGGRVFSLLITTGIEAVIGRKLNPKYEAYIHSVGMILLLVLMAAVTFKDIFTIIKR